PATQYLQTSPESSMKQLLAKGSGSIYQICKAYRRDPPGKLHACEFTILEWYRTGYTLAQIIDDTLALVESVIGRRPADIISYREAFIRYAGADPHCLQGKNLREFAREKICVEFDDKSDDVWLDLLHSHLVEPQLGRDCYTIVHSYPASQAAMAEIVRDNEGAAVAARFELYVDGIELANGYQELTDADEQQRRFERDNATRCARGLPPVPIDQPLLNAMREPGLPACAGVALGVDRLLLLLQNSSPAAEKNN
ncbi:MAG: EF-P lysine aminoacylase GenX, partial [Gammaproteobacteria bacterium]|nr:EF-P lysine aminoacylase GenX [Gammaproteobacteria bacterium]